MDWRDIIPLKESEALDVVSKYFSNHGFAPKRVDADKRPHGEHSPDIVGQKNGHDVFLCEVKSPAHIFDKKIGLYKWSTTFNKLRSRIHTAVKQFNDYDNGHVLPRIVAFTSNHPQLNWTQLHHNIIGTVKYGDKILKNFRGKTFVTDTDNDIKAVDLFLWFQVNYINRSSIAELAIYQNKDSKLEKQVTEMSLKLNPHKEENIKIPRYSAL